MSVYRCVKKDLGYVGCSSDILPAMDKMCSGSHSCDFRIPDLDVMVDRSETPCLEELKSYLEASHTCVKGN